MDFFASILSQKDIVDFKIPILPSMVLHNLNGFTKLFFDQFTLRNFQPLERFEKCTFYLLFLLVISIRTFRTERVVGIRSIKLRLSSLVL